MCHLRGQHFHVSSTEQVWLAKKRILVRAWNFDLVVQVRISILVPACLFSAPIQFALLPLPAMAFIATSVWPGTCVPVVAYRLESPPIIPWGYFSSWQLHGQISMFSFFLHTNCTRITAVGVRIIARNTADRLIDRKTRVESPKTQEKNTLGK